MESCRGLRIARVSISRAILFVAVLLIGLGCEGEKPAPPQADGPIRVASLVPAATDLIVGMGAADQIVAVSNFDTDQLEPIAGLPRVGDYQNIDWERLQQLRPDLLVIFHAPDRVSPGVRQRAEALGVELVNVRPETLANTLDEIDRLGRLIGQEQKATALRASMEQRLDAVRQRVAGKPPVRTLIVMNEQATFAVGRSTFLNDLLEIAGGVNVVETDGWPTLDRERRMALAADATIVLLSGVPEHVEQAAEQQLEGRVLILNAWYTQQPGSRLPEMAERFADFLHPGN